MTGPEILDVGRDSLWTMLMVAAPVLVVALVVGLVISLFQALTQIQEQTLTFVPKLVAIVITLLIALPFMGSQLNGLMHRLADHVITGDIGKSG